MIHCVSTFLLFINYFLLLISPALIASSPLPPLPRKGRGEFNYTMLQRIKNFQVNEKPYDLRVKDIYSAFFSATGILR